MYMQWAEQAAAQEHRLPLSHWKFAALEAECSFSKMGKPKDTILPNNRVSSFQGRARLAVEKHLPGGGVLQSCQAQGFCASRPPGGSHPSLRTLVWTDSRFHFLFATETVSSFHNKGIPLFLKVLSRWGRGYVGKATTIFYIYGNFWKKKIFNFHSNFAFNLRDKLKPETNMRKKAAAQRRRQVHVERVRREPWGFLHVARGDHCDRIEGWYSRTSQNQV